MHEGLIVGIAGVFGLVFGSFATVVAWRVPRKESIVQPGSHCPACDAPVAAYDNIPVVSYVVLRGHCRRCHAGFGVKYPLTELAVAGLFVAVAWRVQPRWAIPAYCVLALALVILADVDLEHRRLPVAIVYPALIAGAALLVLSAVATRNWQALEWAAIGGASMFVIFAAIWFATRGGMGFGDVRLAGLCGMFLGYFGWRIVAVGFLATAVIAGVVGIALFATGNATRKTALPYGPFLAVGTMVGVLAGGPIATAWLGH
jgi:leader peptidase (prepilin peptidase)/N-methyltransferase